MERRREKRVSNLGIIESFNFHSSSQSVVINAPMEISLIDISIGGLGIKSSTYLEIDTTLSIHIQLETDNFVVIGKVVWCRKENNLYTCGLKLIYMPEELHTFLDDSGDQLNKYIN